MNDEVGYVLDSDSLQTIPINPWMCRVPIGRTKFLGFVAKPVLQRSLLDFFPRSVATNAPLLSIDSCAFLVFSLICARLQQTACSLQLCSFPPDTHRFAFKSHGKLLRLCLAWFIFVTFSWNILLLVPTTWVSCFVRQLNCFLYLYWHCNRQLQWAYQPCASMA